MHKNNTAGFTLTEIMVTTALLLVVSALVLVALQSSARAVDLNQALAATQQDARLTMMMIAREVEFAVKPAPTGFSLPLGVEGIEITQGGSSIVFQLPTDRDFLTFSTPITIRFEPEHKHVVLVQNGQSRVLGAANTINFLGFELIENSILRVMIRTTSRISPTQNRVTQSELQSDIYIMN